MGTSFGSHMKNTSRIHNYIAALIKNKELKKRIIFFFVISYSLYTMGFAFQAVVSFELSQSQASSILPIEINPIGSIAGLLVSQTYFPILMALIFSLAISRKPVSTYFDKFIWFSIPLLILDSVLVKMARIMSLQLSPSSLQLYSELKSGFGAMTIRDSYLSQGVLIDPNDSSKNIILGSLFKERNFNFPKGGDETNIFITSSGDHLKSISENIQSLGGYSENFYIGNLISNCIMFDDLQIQAISGYAKLDGYERELKKADTISFLKST
jgi:hypothetical protein